MTGVQTCALPIFSASSATPTGQPGEAHNINDEIHPRHFDDVCSTFHFDSAGMLWGSQSYHLARYLFLVGGVMKHSMTTNQQIARTGLTAWTDSTTTADAPSPAWATRMAKNENLTPKPDRAMRKELALMMGILRLNTLLQLITT